MATRGPVTETPGRELLVVHSILGGHTEHGMTITRLEVCAIPEKGRLDVFLVVGKRSENKCEYRKRARMAMSSILLDVASVTMWCAAKDLLKIEPSKMLSKYRNRA